MNRNGDFEDYKTQELLNVLEEIADQLRAIATAISAAHASK